MERIVLMGPPGKRVHTPEGLVEISASGTASVSPAQAEYLAERKDAGFLTDIEFEVDHGVQDPEQGKEPPAPEGEMNLPPAEGQPEGTGKADAAGADTSAPAKRGGRK